MKVIKPNTISPVDGTFTRASSGTYYNSVGTLVQATTNIPRFNYKSFSHEFQGILLEQASTNLLINSEDFTNASWSRTNCSISSNTSAAPDGAITADKYIPNSASTSSSVFSSSIAASLTDVTLSLFVKKAEYEHFSLSIFNSGSLSATAVFDLNTEILVSTSASNADFTNIEAGIEKLANSLYRCYVKATKGSVDTVVRAKINPLTPSLVEPVGNGTDGFYIWGAQLELQSKPTSYIKTASTSVTRAADVVTGSGLIYSTLTDPNPVYSSGTTYAVDAVVRYGSMLYKSLQVSNTNHQPDISPTWWYLIGSDNIHAAFDTAISTKSTATASMTLVIKPGKVDSIALIDLSAATVKVSVTDPVEGTVFTGVSGLSDVESYDWWQYFFNDPIIRRTQIVFTDIPQYENALVTVLIEGDIAEVVSIAQILLGQLNTLGETNYGAGTGIIDYSTKNTDEFGNTSFVKRAFSKRLNAQVVVLNSQFNRVQNLLYSIRATPVVWIASDDPIYEEALIIFGFYREFSTEIAYPSFSTCSLEIESLV